MNFSQKFGLFILVVITAAYVYFSFFNQNFTMPDFGKRETEREVYNPVEQPQEVVSEEPVVQKDKTVSIYLIDSNNNIRSVNRVCEVGTKPSCFAFAINELVKAPSRWEKSHGFTSEIPSQTRILSIRESKDSVMIDLSSDFAAGGGTESIYKRVKQIIKTSKANTQLPVYLYINGSQANVIGGDGIMLRQPLTERSIDE